MVLAKRRIIVDVIATADNISQDSAHQIIYDVYLFFIKSTDDVTRGRRLDLDLGMQKGLHDQHKSFYLERMRKLIKRWVKVDQ
ncbi:hypothetical protein TNIN_150001 [Trichonephila inaurata madagascariensis]|uniref:Uncharacterized protein n=1 Tax=Trichonephila inaurata madagascariensis TaxID=2747483 RepID=A0A8X6Y5N0_9ARAC|nr:hypothetical protein TNIN_150001 [Trichonephila inaurata madagascariensis]